MMFQSWRRLLFAHWPVPRDVLRALVPEQLELDDYDGQTYVAVTPFRLHDLRLRFLPPFPFGSTFAEVNCRTYVRVGDKAGIFFFSLDAESPIAVAGARTAFRLPYHVATMRIRDRDGWIDYRSKRHSSTAALSLRYRPVGSGFYPLVGTLEHFLVERYALYAVLKNGIVMRGDIQHAPWRLQPAEAEIQRNTIPDASGITLPDTAPILHYSSRQDTLVWPLGRV